MNRLSYLVLMCFGFSIGLPGLVGPVGFVGSAKAHTTNPSAGAPEPKSLASGSVESLDKVIRASQYWVRPGKKGQNTAAYMTLENTTGPAGEALVAASSTLCREIQLHQTQEEKVEDHQVSKMRQVDQIDLPPRQAVTLDPGGYHLMLIGLNQEIQQTEGATVDLTLTFTGGRTLQLNLPVQKQGVCACCEQAAKSEKAS